MEKPLRRVGDITMDLEPLLEELSFEHDLQHGEVLSLVYSWLNIHAPGQKEEYLDGTEPEYYYGPRRN